MATHDYIISNGTGSVIRADINNALSAIVTNNSSSSEPATKYAYMWWADTSAGLLKIRNSANDAWITLFQLDGTLTLEDGSNSAPAISFRDDTNTGIFSSGADNLDVTTGGTTRVNVSSAGINVTGTVTDDGAIHDGDVTFTGASANIIFDKSDNALEFADNAKALFGNSSDLEIYHNGTHSDIHDSGSGNLRIRSDKLQILNTEATEQIANFNQNGAVELYHNNTKRFETHTSGNTFYGSLYGLDGSKIELGHSGDLQIYHSGSHSFIDDTGTGDMYIRGDNALKIQNAAGSEQKIVANTDGSVDLYYNGTKRIETTSTGIKVIQDVVMDVAGDTAIRWANSGTNKWSIFNNSSASDTLTIFDNNGSGTAAKFLTNGAVELYFDNSLKLATTTTGVQVSGTNLNMNSTYIDFGGSVSTPSTAAAIYRPADNNLAFSTANTERLLILDDGKIRVPDNGKFVAGVGSDLEIYHTGTSSKINNATGSLLIQSDAAGFYGESGSETMATFAKNGAVELYHDNVKKLHTDSFGVIVSGGLALDGDNLELRIGNSQDLKILHDGTDNLLSTSGTVLAVHRATTNSGNPVFEVRSNHGATNQVKFKVDGDGDVLIPTDTGKLQLGAGQDLQLYHNGNHSYIEESGTGNLYIRSSNTRMQSSAGEDQIIMAENGAVELYYDNTKRFETTSTGASVTGSLGVTDGTTQVSLTKTSNTPHIDFKSNDVTEACQIKAAESSGGGVLQFFTKTTGGTATQRVSIDTGGNLNIPNDSGKLQIGASQDLELFHDGTDSHIRTHTTGSLINRARVSWFAQTNATDSGADHSIKALQNGGVELYHDNVKKFETTSFGATVQGGITFGSDTAAANQMDDYEEGVFTPSLEFGGATTGITYSSMRGGSYTKIGRQVTVNFGFTLTSKGSASGDATIAGLPFAIEDLLSSTSVEASGISSFWNDIATDSANIVFAALGGTSELELRNTVGAEDDTDAMDDGDFDNDTAIRGSITYFTAT